jgi:ComF family protein
VRAAFRYAPPVDGLVHGAKYAGRLDWAALLGRQLAKRFAPHAASIDALVAVPSHRSRLRERGYNQSLELARPLAKRLNIPLRDSIARIRATPPQTALSREERRKNMQRAFTATDDVAQLRLAVVDDVMTSGATAEAIARCLLKAGAKSVEIWVVARA